MPVWRKHQQQVLKQAKRIKHARLKNTDLFTEVVPGGGKSKNVSILATQLKESGLAESVIWITPRRSLQAQAVESIAERMEGVLPFRIGDSVFRPRPQGFATNFQSLLADPRGHLAALKALRGPSLLVVDEAHFCRGGDDLEGWSEALVALRKEVFDRGGHQLTMSGTMRRWDENPVCNLPYDPSCRFHLDPERTIGYYREDGVDDGAITRIQPQFFDGYVQWQKSSGELGTASPELLSSFGHIHSPGLVGRAVKAFLHEANLENVHLPVIWDSLTRPKQGWLRYKTIYGNNQIIIVADRQSTAVKLVNVLNGTGFRSSLRAKSRSLGYPFNDDFRAVLAISDDSWSCRAIDSYRHGRLVVDFPQRRIGSKEKVNAIGPCGAPIHCLVTVGMASIGLDAPACTHFVNLTNIRSIPWMTQAIARAWRSGKYEWPHGRDPVPVKRRMAYVWMPADVRMRATFNAICDDSYAKGLSKYQLANSWHLFDDPTPSSGGLDALADKEPDSKPEKSSQTRPVYEPIVGVTRVVDIRSEAPR